MNTSVADTRRSERTHLTQRLWRFAVSTARITIAIVVACVIVTLLVVPNVRESIVRMCSAYITPLTRAWNVSSSGHTTTVTRTPSPVCTPGTLIACSSDDVIGMRMCSQDGMYFGPCMLIVVPATCSHPVDTEPVVTQEPDILELIDCDVHTKPDAHAVCMRGQWVWIDECTFDTDCQHSSRCRNGHCQ